MKKMNVVALALAAAMVVGFASCELSASIKPAGNDTNNNGGSTGGSSSSGVDFTNHTGGPLTVKNNTSDNMVLFMGKPSANAVLGGVKANDTVTVDKTIGNFSKSKDYVVYVVKESDYVTNKNNLTVLDSSPFQTFYAVYNDNSPNENVYEVSAFLGGQYKMIVNNGSQYNVEFRNMSETGPAVAFSLGKSYEVSYALKEGEYMLFPVFRKYDSRSGEILSTYPTYKEGQLAGEAKSYEFSLDSETKSREFNVKDFVGGINFTPSAAYIKIINNADQGLKFYTSAQGEAETTSAGGKRINTGTELTYSINMAKLTSNKYEEAKIASGYRLATNRVNDIYLAGDATKSTTYKAGYLYTYTVTGSADSVYKVEALKNDDGSLLAQQVDWSSF